MSNDDDVPLDLRTLRVSEPPDLVANEEAFVAAVMGEVRRLDVSARVADPLLGLRDLAVPFLAVASLVILATLAWRGRVDSAEHRPRSVAEAVGVPPEFLGAAPRRIGER